MGRSVQSRTRWPVIPLALTLLLGSIAGLLAFGAAPARASGWVIECVDCPKVFLDMTDRSLRLDMAGHPHIAYGGDHLYYAWHDGVGWHYETADDSPGVGRFASLALDGSGYPHISYYDEDNYDLKYAYRDASGRHIETVDTEPGHWGGYTSLALDGGGYPHISYYDKSNSDLKYASFSECVPVKGVAVNGPASLLVGETGIYTATFSPLTATLPVTFTWDNGTIGPTATYSWTLPGTYTLVVTATNPCGGISATLTVKVSAVSYRIYLPLILRDQ